MGILLRTFTTIIAYSVFFVGALFNGILVYLFLIVFCRSKRERELKLRATVNAGFRIFLWLCRVLRVFKVNVENIDGLEAINSAVIIVNHPTLVDYVIITAHMNIHSSVMVKHALTNGFMRFVIKHMGYVTNQSGYEEFEALLTQGDNILIFPEGTRTRDPNKLKFQRGAMNLAIRKGVPILPLYLYCDVAGYLNRGFLSIKAPKREPTFLLKVGDIIPVDNFPNDGPDSIRVRHLTKELEGKYEAFLKTCMDSASLEK